MKGMGWRYGGCSLLGVMGLGCLSVLIEVTSWIT